MEPKAKQLRSSTARRQVISGGRHPSGENYIWFDGCGPEALAAPNALWWEFIKGCYLRAVHGL